MCIKIKTDLCRNKTAKVLLIPFGTAQTGFSRTDDLCNICKANANYSLFSEKYYNTDKKYCQEKNQKTQKHRKFNFCGKLFNFLSLIL